MLKLIEIPFTTDLGVLETEYPNIIVSMEHAYQNQIWALVCRFRLGLNVTSGKVQVIYGAEATGMNYASD